VCPSSFSLSQNETNPFEIDFDPFAEVIGIDFDPFAEALEAVERGDDHLTADTVNRITKQQ
jgi:hypothetical protein